MVRNFYRCAYVLSLLSQVRARDVHFYTKQYSPNSMVSDFVQFYNAPKFLSRIMVSWEIYSNSTHPVNPKQNRFSSYFYAINIFAEDYNSSTGAFYSIFYKPFDVR